MCEIGIDGKSLRTGCPAKKAGRMKQRHLAGGRKLLACFRRARGLAGRNRLVDTQGNLVGCWKKNTGWFGFGVAGDRFQLHEGGDALDIRLRTAGRVPLCLRSRHSHLNEYQLCGTIDPKTIDKRGDAGRNPARPICDFRWMEQWVILQQRENGTLWKSGIDGRHPCS